MGLPVAGEIGAPGAGVVCSFASLAARERPVPFPGGEEDEEEEEKSKKSVTRKNFSGEERRAPCACERGQRCREGRVVERAEREACSHWGTSVQALGREFRRGSTSEHDICLWAGADFDKVGELLAVFGRDQLVSG